MVQTGLGLSARSITAATPHRVLTLATLVRLRSRPRSRTGTPTRSGGLPTRSESGSTGTSRTHTYPSQGPERDQRRLAVRPPDGSDHEYRDRRDTGRYCPGCDFTYEMLVDYVRVYQGDWTATDGGYVAAAEGVISLASEVYPDETGTNWFPWGAAQYQDLSMARTGMITWTIWGSSRTSRSICRTRTLST